MRTTVVVVVVGFGARALIDSAHNYRQGKTYAVHPLFRRTVIIVAERSG